MAKMKIYELAKSLGVPSKELVTFLNTKGIEVKSHMSSIEDEAIGLIAKKFAPSLKTHTSKEQPTSEKKKPEKREEEKPKQKPETEEKKAVAPERNATETVSKNEEPKVTPQATPQGTPQATPQGKPQVTPGTPSSEKPVATEQKGAQGRPVPLVSPETKRENTSRTSNGSYNGNRQNNGSYNNGNRTGGYQGNRPQNGTSGGQRPYNNGTGQGSRPYQGRPNTEGRPAGTQGGYQGNRNNYNRPSRPGQEGRPAGQGGYQGNRPYNGTGARPQGGRPGAAPGSRPYGDRSGAPGGNRPYNGQGSRPYRPGGGRPDGPQKDDKTSAVSVFGQKSGRGERFQNKHNKNTYDHRKDNQPKKDPNRKGAFIKPKPVEKVMEPEDGIKTLTLPEKLTLKELADKMKIQASVIIKKLFLAGKMYSINQALSYEEAEEIALDYNCICEKEVVINPVEELLKEQEEDPSLLAKRPPVVCVMGHVDHGKTSLLDAIRSTHVTTREAGGITQHIGASVVTVNGESITFLDTPGHEAFTSMRMRGAQATDIAILVVAADDGVMPQTIEAINHAKAAKVPIIVAINKIDKESANVERVKQELMEYELVAEEWGGDTIFVPVSAHTKEGIQQLLEMILLTAEVEELKANPNRMARGLVIEAQLDKGRGPVATVLVQKGTLHVGDNVAIGATHGKIRAMMDDHGTRVESAGPSTPVEILGLNGVPDTGEIMMAVDTDKEARSIAETFITQSKEKLIENTKAKLSLDGLFSQIQAGSIKELNLIVKADVQGSVEAVKQSLEKLSNEEVAVRVIHGGVGAINESDVTLASASNAIIIGFNVKPDNTAKEIVDREHVDLRLYRVIYDAISDMEAAMKGMLEPIFEEQVTGHAEIRQVFKASGLGNIAGSYVLDGKITRGSSARITRDGEQIFDGPLASLKRFKDDVKEVAAGYECGLVFEKFSDIMEGDQVEIYAMVEVPR